jgi:hypothetical protein
MSHEQLAIMNVLMLPEGYGDRAKKNEGQERDQSIAVKILTHGKPDNLDLNRMPRGTIMIDAPIYSTGFPDESIF